MTPVRLLQPAFSFSVRHKINIIIMTEQEGVSSKYLSYFSYLFLYMYVVGWLVSPLNSLLVLVHIFSPETENCPS